MNSIRIGNDINIAWSIYRCGDAEPLTLSALTLYMTCGYRKVQVQDFKVDGNKITFTFHGKDQANTGIYGLTLVGNAGQDGMFTVDACGAFKLVGSQCAGCLDTDGVEVDLRSDIQAPANGLSAYEIAVLDGFQGTEEEWLASLKQPAVDAAEEADKAAQSATDAAGKADTAAGSANQAAEAATQAADGATEAAAHATEAAGEAGKAASAATEAATLANQAASGANSAKNAANEAAQDASQAAETANEAAKAADDAASAASGIAGEVSANNEQWQAAESQRQAAEEKRQQDTQEAISGANTARDAANQAAQDANTAAEAANEAAELAAQAKELLFRDLWKTACGTYGTYNEETGFYELNGLTDITYEQAIVIYNAGEPTYMSCNFTGFKGRTNLVSPISGGYGFQRQTPTCFCQNAPNLEKFVFATNAYISDFQRCFVCCRKLKEIVGIIVCSSNGMKFAAPGAHSFDGCFELTDVRIKQLNENIDFKDCSKISLETLDYVVTNAQNTSAINIYVHPEVYAKLTDSTNAEWYAVLQAANEKNIAFATTE